MSGRLRGAVLATVALLLTSAPRPARAACSAAGGCPSLVATCCGATSCTLDGTITVTDTACALDFGSRDVTLSGALDAGAHVVTITAGSLHITGRLSATGSQGIIRVQAPPGGTLGRVGVPGLSLTDRGRIDLSGTNGATLIVVADGAVELSGAQGSLVKADATDAGGAGGTIDLTSRGESVTIGMPLSLAGGDGGLGGTLRLSAATDLTFTPSATSVSVAAGFEAGNLELDGGRTVALQLGSKLEATGLPLSGGSGGSIDIAGGTIDAEGVLDVTGGTGGTGGIGGDGGFITIEARHGPLTIMRPPRAGLGIQLDGAPGGDSGEVDLTTDSPVSGTLTVAAPVSARGGITSNAGSGGTVSLDAASTLRVDASLDVSALTGDAGEIDLNPNDENVDVVVNAKLDGSSASTGGVLSIGSSHDIEFTANSSVKMNAVGSVEGSGGPGGEVTLTARRDIRFDADPAGLMIDTSGSGALPGGIITAIAGSNLSLGKGVALNANGGVQTGACGGTVTLKAGANDLGDPDRPGDITVDGQVSAGGNDCSTPRTVACDDSHEGGCSIILEGCQVTITGAVDSTDLGVPSANLVIGRKAITVSGTLRATGGSNAAYSSTSPQTAGARIINPALGPCRMCTAGLIGTSCTRDADCDPPGGAGNGRCMTTGCVRPPCTGRDPTTRVLVPEGCLVPCPLCGNGAPPEFPEECDDGNTADCDGCDPHCRLPARPTCEDGNSCTSDTCDRVYGCLNDPVPEGTTCDDGNLCTTGDTCRSGACQGGGATQCDDLNVCSADSCVPATGCTHDAISCDDHNPCTLGPDTCDASRGCQHGTLKDCGLGKVCDPTTPNGDCVQKPCSPNGPNPACDDGNPCTADVCEGGLCQSTPLDGSACDDTTLCNGRETCRGGVCVSGPPLPADCDDQDPCTVDSACDATTGCTGHNDPIAGCVRCNPGDTCDDANPCTTDTCLPEGICAHENKADCCTVDQDCADKDCMQKSCNRQINECAYTPTPGVACGGGCEGPELERKAGTCNASGACCDAQEQCPPAIDACPTDEDSCTDDICDAQLGHCVHRPVPPPACSHNDAECDDGNACTRDTCGDAGCTYDLVSPTCVPCAKDADCGGRCLGRACVAGVCTDVPPFTCAKPGTVCRLDAGQPVCRCSDSRGCDDGNACNGKETCVTATGACVGGTPLTCDDGNVCTEDSCNPATGCVNAGSSGFGGITTQLTAVEGAVGAASPGDLAPSLAKVVRTKTSVIRAKLTAAQAVAGSSVKREGRMLKAATKTITGLANAIGKASKGRKPKISASLADSLRARLACAGAAVQGLQAELAR